MLIALRKVFVAPEEVSRFSYIGHKFIDLQFTPVDRLIFTGWSDQGPHAHQTCNDSGVLHQFFFWNGTGRRAACCINKKRVKPLGYKTGAKKKTLQREFENELSRRNSNSIN